MQLGFTRYYSHKRDNESPAINDDDDNFIEENIVHASPTSKEDGGQTFQHYSQGPSSRNVQVDSHLDMGDSGQHRRISMPISARVCFRNGVAVAPPFPGVKSVVVVVSKTRMRLMANRKT